MGSVSHLSPLPLGMFFSSQLVKSCNEGARAMERTEQMYTLQKQLEFGKKKVRSCGSGGGNPSGKPGLGCWMQAASKGCSKAMPVSPTVGV